MEITQYAEHISRRKMHHDLSAHPEVNCRDLLVDNIQYLEPMRRIGVAGLKAEDQIGNDIGACVKYLLEIDRAHPIEITAGRVEESLSFEISQQFRQSPPDRPG